MRQYSFITYAFNVKGLSISLQCISLMNMAEMWPLDIPHHPLMEGNMVAIIASLVTWGQILYCSAAICKCFQKILDITLLYKEKCVMNKVGYTQKYVDVL